MGAMDPFSTIMGLMNTLGSYFNTAQQSGEQQQVFGQQEANAAFAQNPAQMNQFMTALQQPYSYANMATPGTAAQTGQYLSGLQDPLSNVANAGTAGQMSNYFGGYQDPLSNVANPQTAGQMNQYLQGYQTPYQQQLQAQQGMPGQTGSLLNQYTQGLNSALTSNVWNQVQGQLGQSGMSQSPSVAAYDYAQALAPTEQQNVQNAMQLMQQPTQYSLAEQQYGLQAGQVPMNWQQAQQQYGLQAGQVPMNWQQAQQQYGLQAGQMPLTYGMSSAQLGAQEAQQGLQYPFNIGSMMAGSFPNYQMAYSGGTTP